MPFPTVMLLKLRFVLTNAGLAIAVDEERAVAGQSAVRLQSVF
jgi:hypothetical protein